MTVVPELCQNTGKSAFCPWLYCWEEAGVGLAVAAKGPILTLPDDPVCFASDCRTLQAITTNRQILPQIATISSVFWHSTGFIFPPSGPCMISLGFPISVEVVVSKGRWSCGSSPQQKHRLGLHISCPYLTSCSGPLTLRSAASGGVFVYACGWAKNL
jgi:hypothetical protein